jgi:hypothetical protein
VVEPSSWRIRCSEVVGSVDLAQRWLAPGSCSGVDCSRWLLRWLLQVVGSRCLVRWLAPVVSSRKWIWFQKWIWLQTWLAPGGLLKVNLAQLLAQEVVSSEVVG